MRSKTFSPPGHITFFELQNSPIDVFKLHKIRGSTDFRALKLRSGRLGRISFSSKWPLSNKSELWEKGETYRQIS